MFNKLSINENDTFTHCTACLTCYSINNENFAGIIWL